MTGIGVMVDVLDEGPDPSVVKRVVCKFCGATLQYVPRAVLERNGTDYGGGPDGEEWIVCPRCNKKVILRSW